LKTNNYVFLLLLLRANWKKGANYSIVQLRDLTMWKVPKTKCSWNLTTSIKGALRIAQ